ncbi:hypothetical protein HMPREF2976_10025 [Corynebacterium sp. HMSC077D10]|nr:hypothetical protein HMPREF2976_10025 [Corynebacterium sp. HMSC077D10]
MLVRMRYVLFAFSAFFCLAAIGSQLFGAPRLVAVVCMVLAALALVIGLVYQGRVIESQEKVLNEEQTAELERLLDNGQFGVAVGQVRLWFRGTSEEEAEAVVHSLAQGR